MTEFLKPLYDVGNKDLKIDEMVGELRQLLATEEEAVQLYNRVAMNVAVKDVAGVLRSIASEEQVHIGELQKLLKKYSDGETEALSRGESEVNEMVFTSSDEAIQRLAEITGCTVVVNDQ